jgi:hypothetical protein
LEGCYRFIFGRLQKAAGVDNHHVGPAWVVGAVVAGLQQHLANAFTIKDVFGTAKRQQVKGRFFLFSSFAGHSPNKIKPGQAR